MKRLAISVLLLAHAAGAHALRPYDSTDAAVAGPGEFELELGPVGWLRQGDRRFRVAPAVVANYGIAEDRELVVQGERRVALDPEAGEPRAAIVDNGVFFKDVLKQGALQDKPGWSLATEYGVLLPEIHGTAGAGLTIAGLASQRTEAMSLHLNGAIALNRDHEPELFLGAIVEGPYAWPVRPVAEVFGDQVSGSARILSGLVGAIWRARKDLSLDVGARAARQGGESIRELRLGLTWNLAL
ncbi:MAG TPA: hypothetical protein VNH80_01460, partial [Burkholderiales bacterium]|nr:hypothetical protein [Burkholderiales bacterium]